MAQAVVHGKESFKLFEEQMISRGWERVNKKTTIDVLRQLEAVSPHAGKFSLEMEVGFTYFAFGKGLRCYIWSSYEEALGSTRVGWDFGKVIITESNRIVYYGPEIRRTKFFFERLLIWADILQERVDNRPICKLCGRLMTIFHSVSNQYYWHCVNPEHSRKIESWDSGMKTPRLILFLKKKRNLTREYNIFRQKMGKPKKGVARKRRRAWKYLKR